MKTPCAAVLAAAEVCHANCSTPEVGESMRHVMTHVQMCWVQRLGVCEDEVKGMFLRCPSLLTTPLGNITSRIAVLVGEGGVVGRQLCGLVTRAPRCLRSDVAELRAKLRYLASELHGSREVKQGHARAAARVLALPMSQPRVPENTCVMLCCNTLHCCERKPCHCTQSCRRRRRICWPGPSSWSTPSAVALGPAHRFCSAS